MGSRSSSKASSMGVVFGIVAVLLACSCAFFLFGGGASGPSQGDSKAATTAAETAATMEDLAASGGPASQAEGSQAAGSQELASQTASSPDSTPHQLGELRAHFIDVGQGDSEFLELPDGTTMLIDAGEASAGQAVVSYIKALGYTRIDHVVATHPHADHIGGLPKVLSSFDVGDVWAPEATTNTSTFNAFLDAVEAKGLGINVLEKGVSIVSQDAGYTVVALGPPAGMESDDLNDYSAILRVTYGSRTFLFTGDAGVREIFDADPGRVDVLKVGHHGSWTSTSTSLAKELSPSIAVISYGAGNSYGHPHKRALKALQAAGARVYGTAVNGSVTVSTDGSSEPVVQVEREGTVVAGESESKSGR